MYTQPNIQTSTFKSRKVVGYARVSTDIQREKESIKTQVELIERYCEQNGWTLVETICDDSVSGTIPLPQRAGGAKLLQNARAGKFTAVVIYKVDRLGRESKPPAPSTTNSALTSCEYPSALTSPRRWEERCSPSNLLSGDWNARTSCNARATRHFDLQRLEFGWGHRSLRVSC